MPEPDMESLDDAEQTLPVSPARRKARRAIGCLFLVVILGLLVWFGVTHTESVRNRGFLGMARGDRLPPTVQYPIAT
jgi:hypothetical protein